MRARRRAVSNQVNFPTNSLICTAVLDRPNRKQIGYKFPRLVTHLATPAQFQPCLTNTGAGTGHPAISRTGQDRRGVCSRANRRKNAPTPARRNQISHHGAHILCSPWYDVPDHPGNLQTSHPSWTCPYYAVIYGKQSKKCHKNGDIGTGLWRKQGRLRIQSSLAS